MRRLGTASIAFVCYGAFVVYLTWPLAPNAATHLPKTASACGFDNLYSGWVLSHQSTALVTDPTRITETNDFHPATNTLFYGPTATGALPYFAPVFLLTGNPTLALNVTLYLSIVLTALCLHLAVRHWTGSHLAGSVAGCAFLLTRWILWEWLPTTPHWAVLQYFPAIILLAAVPAPGLRRYGALLGLVVLQCLTDLVYVAPAVLVPLGFLAVVRLARRRTRSAGAALLGVVALGGLLLLIPAAGHLRLGADNPGLDHQSFWPIDEDWFRKYGTPIPWGLFYRNAPTALPRPALWLIGAGGLSLLLRRAGRPRDAWIAAALWAGVGTVISLTPSVHLGDRSVDLPHAWLNQWIPVYRVIRVPSRLGVSALMGLCLLAGLAFAECSARLAGLRAVGRAAPLVKGVFAAVVLGAMFVHYRASLPPALRQRVLGPHYEITPAIGPDGPFMPLLRQAGGPLVEFPAHLSDDLRVRAMAPSWHASAMYRSIFHARKILNGYASYWPAGFPERMALVARFPDAAAVAELRATTGLELFWVHAGTLTASARAWWIAFADAGGREDLSLVARDGNELLFSVRP